MKATNVLYHYKERKMDPFGWIMIFYIITFLFLLSFVMVLLPIRVITQTITIWSILLLLLIPLGGWLAVKTFSYARGLIWHNNHLTSYAFQRDSIQIEKWDKTYDREPANEQLELSSIQKVVIAPYIVNEWTSKHGTKHIDMNHIIYIVHSSNYKKELYMLPFPNKEDYINIWLRYFQEQNIPVHFTNEILYRYDRKILSDDKRMEILEANHRLIPVTSNGEWKQLSKELQAEWNNRFPGMHDVGSNRKAHELQEQHGPQVYGTVGQNDKKSKFSFRLVANVTLLVYALMIGASFGLIKLAENGVFSADSLLPIVVVILFGGILYFYLLRNHLRWYFMLILSFKVFFFGIVTGVSFEEMNEYAYQIGENILGVSMVFPFVVWVPYLIVKALNNTKRAKVE